MTDRRCRTDLLNRPLANLTAESQTRLRRRAWWSIPRGRSRVDAITTPTKVRSAARDARRDANPEPADRDHPATIAAGPEGSPRPDKRRTTPIESQWAGLLLPPAFPSHFDSPPVSTLAFVTMLVGVAPFRRRCLPRLRSHNGSVLLSGKAGRVSQDGHDAMGCGEARVTLRARVVCRAFRVVRLCHAVHGTPARRRVIAVARLPRFSREIDADRVRHDAE